MFGTCNTQFIHNLRGNTQITREVRQVTVSVNPKGMATWTLGDLNERLNEYLFDVYDQMDHPALGQSPREAFARGFEASGLRLQRMIPYDQNFILCTMPSTAKSTATLSPGRGVKTQPRILLVRRVFAIQNSKGSICRSDMIRSMRERLTRSVETNGLNAIPSITSCFTVAPSGRSCWRQKRFANNIGCIRHNDSNSQCENTRNISSNRLRRRKMLLVQRVCDRESAAVRSGAGSSRSPQDTARRHIQSI